MDRLRVFYLEDIPDKRFMREMMRLLIPDPLLNRKDLLGVIYDSWKDDQYPIAVDLATTTGGAIYQIERSKSKGVNYCCALLDMKIETEYTGAIERKKFQQLKKTYDVTIIKDSWVGFYIWRELQHLFEGVPCLIYTGHHDIASDLPMFCQYPSVSPYIAVRDNDDDIEELAAFLRRHLQATSQYMLKNQSSNFKLRLGEDLTKAIESENWPAFWKNDDYRKLLPFYYVVYENKKVVGTDWRTLLLELKALAHRLRHPCDGACVLSRFARSNEFDWSGMPDYGLDEYSVSSPVTGTAFYHITHRERKEDNLLPMLRQARADLEKVKYLLADETYEYLHWRIQGSLDEERQFDHWVTDRYGEAEWDEVKSRLRLGYQDLCRHLLGRKPTEEECGPLPHNEPRIYVDRVRISAALQALWGDLRENYKPIATEPALRLDVQPTEMILTLSRDVDENWWDWAKFRQLFGARGKSQQAWHGLRGYVNWRLCCKLANGCEVTLEDFQDLLNDRLKLEEAFNIRMGGVNPVRIAHELIFTKPRRKMP